mmetsp:Transcript_47102/g.98649  ORF Transcript_47102/g.98649 Transcript_47102/m.98649 type:complete len:109 (+) Transcript_47102:1237-1563(+)
MADSAVHPCLFCDLCYLLEFVKTVFRFCAKFCKRLAGLLKFHDVGIVLCESRCKILVISKTVDHERILARNELIMYLKALQLDRVWTIHGQVWLMVWVSQFICCEHCL